MNFLNLTATLTLTIRYPSGGLHSNSFLFLRGSAAGLSWDKGVRVFASGHDAWSIVLPGQPVGSNPQFKALIDDSQWAIGVNGVLSINETRSAEYYPFFTSTSGRYEYVRGVQSSRLGNTRDLVVYVPPGYDENPYATYSSVLLMQDGENVFNDSTSFGGRSWRAGPTLDTEISAGRMGPVVVVAIDNTMQRTYEYTYCKDPQYGGGGADVYLDFLEETVTPLVLQRYRLQPSARGACSPTFDSRRREPNPNPAAPQNIAGLRHSVRLNQPLRFHVALPAVSILGSSLGGLLACYAAWTRPHAFPHAACMSSSFWWNSSDFLAHQLTRRPSSAPSLLYMDSGTDDGDTDIMKDTIQARRLQIRSAHRVDAGCRLACGLSLQMGFDR